MNSRNKHSTTNKRSVISRAFVCFVATVSSASAADPSSEIETKAGRPPVVLTDQAREIHQSCLLFDGHNDLPWQYRERGMPSFYKLDISRSQPELHTDIARLRKGGVKAQFWSVYVPANTRRTGKALQTTLEQIQLVHDMVKQYPETFALALTADDVQAAVKAGKIASMIGMEGGHSIENSISVLQRLYKLGARYMTLTHSETLEWADSATDEAKHGGLTEFGEEVVREMNRLGMLVDISHVSPDTMKDALRVSTAPVIFSHSSARAIADHPRNVPDEILPLVAKNKGIVMVNFYSGFIEPTSAQRRNLRDEKRRLLLKELDDETAVDREIANWDASHPMLPGSIHDVVDHIDHLVKLAGVDHVGIGSDFDGVGMLPDQLEDVATYPLITQELLNRGYKVEQIHKIMGDNLLRVLRAAEKVAASGN